jgi:hypothetical protein
MIAQVALVLILVVIAIVWTAQRTEAEKRRKNRPPGKTPFGFVYFYIFIKYIN